MKRSVAVVSIVFATVALLFAQNGTTTSPSSRTRTVDAKPTPSPKTATKSATPQTSPSPQKPKPGTTTSVAPTAAVLAAFDKIIEGVRRANVDMATNGYWNSSALILFNYNGTVTRGWDQMRQNRETSYPEMKDVKLEIRDKHVIMLGRDGAVVTCLWTQNQTFKGEPDSATGRMTLVFKRVGAEWKAVHLHTSPDNPDASRIPASEKPTP
ncbi:MAG TPA: nuclear transport factor 2 family protein [Pyrinomonadaceae bacterium]|nr:nuclear transport factor 2 family protein [Pyrinomonadaceae bacterium]